MHKQRSYSALLIFTCQKQYHPNSSLCRNVADPPIAFTPTRKQNEMSFVCMTLNFAWSYVVMLRKYLIYHKISLTTEACAEVGKTFINEHKNILLNARNPWLKHPFSFMFCAELA